MRVGLIGCGLIGKRRAEVVCRSPGDELVCLADADHGKAAAVAEALGCIPVADWRQVTARDDLDAIIVSTPNKYLAPISVAALEARKHVLCEKPPGRNLQEAAWMAEAAARAGKVLKIGFNHRHHPAIRKAHEACRLGLIGAPMFLRAVYGHGGRPGYEREWRADPELSGGGELLDQGIHIVDLCRWFLGEFSEVFGWTPTCFWGRNGAGPLSAGNSKPPLGAPVEDNAFALMRTSTGQVAEWHTSWTQWKNRFSFEVFGSEGYVRVEGLGGSYGGETLVVGRRRRASGPPAEERFDFQGPDLSWDAEWREFVSSLSEGRRPVASKAHRRREPSEDHQRHPRCASHRSPPKGLSRPREKHRNARLAAVTSTG